MIRFALLLGLIVSPAMAQQQPTTDAATLQKAISVLQSQRNQAMDALAGAQTSVEMISEENRKLRLEIEELKKKVPKDEPK